ncbi:MAG: release factor glutamine methyltransferase [Oleiphilaceae bacterium]
MEEGSSLEKQVSIEDVLARWTQLQTETARLDVECLLCHALSRDSTYLRTWPDKILSSEEYLHFESLLTRRQKGEPIAHICGTRAFWSLDLFVTPDTLIPRPDTEILVEQILDLELPKNARILDLGTGTGAIALSLAIERPAWQVTATDFLPEIVLLAKRNAKKYKLANTHIFQSDWFSQIPQESFDLIVSNPPYIDPEDKHLSEGDVRFEPLSALIANKKGLADIKHIIEEAKNYFNKDAWLVLEHGYDQAESVQNLFKKFGFHSIQTIKDYGQQDRMTMARLS